MIIPKDSSHRLLVSDYCGGYIERQEQRLINQGCLGLTVLGSKPSLKIDEVLTRSDQENTTILGHLPQDTGH